MNNNMNNMMGMNNNMNNNMNNMMGMNNNMNNGMGMNNMMMNNLLMNHYMLNQMVNMMSNVVAKKEKIEEAEYKNKKSNEENEDPSEDDQISLVFKRTKDNKINFKITIICKKNEKVKDIINRYCFKTQENKDNLLFFFNGRQLGKERTVEMEGLLNNSIIFVINVKDAYGGI